MLDIAKSRSLDNKYHLMTEGLFSSMIDTKTIESNKGRSNILSVTNPSFMIFDP